MTPLPSPHTPLPPRIYLVAQAFQPVLIGRGRRDLIFLVPKLSLGTHMFSKLGFEGQAQPGAQTRSQAQLGNEILKFFNKGTRRIRQWTNSSLYNFRSSL